MPSWAPKANHERSTPGAGGRRHAARLNFGDCLAYATAAAANDNLLFVGSDFAKTDARQA
jgi:ribonuclease VapC